MPITMDIPKADPFAPPLDSDPSATPLNDHPAQNALPINGWASAMFGIPFMAAGLLPALLTLNKSPSAKHSRDWFVYLIAAIFVLPGAFLFLHGIRGVVRRILWRREAAVRPGEPWFYDHHWRREGIAYSAFDEMLKRLLAVLGWYAFVGIFGWIGVTQRDARPFVLFAAIFGLFGLFIWYRWAQMLFDLLRHGNSFLTYGDFPFALGGTLRARLRSPHNVAAIDELTLTLRCVQEKYVTTGSGQDRSSRVVCYELYSDVATCDRSRLTGLAGNDIPVEFKVPDGKPATNLAATPPTYWEIEAKGVSATGAGYQAYFLVPVYKTN